VSIRPVEFNGMIQNTQEVGNAKTQEDQKPVVQQENTTITLQHEAEQSTHQVQNKDNPSESEHDLMDREGDGRGYEGNQKRREKKKSEPKGDGKVTVKNGHGSFDFKI